MSSEIDIRFRQMKDGTREEYRALSEMEKKFCAGAADRVLAHLRLLENSIGGMLVDRLQHSLQTATRAHRDGRDEAYVTCALLHDIGDVLACENHAEASAAIVKPYVSEELHWMVKHHAVFQGYYFFHHYGGDRNARERYRGHPCFDATAEFCELYDQSSFDPDYDTLPLDFFEPAVRRVFSEPRTDTPLDAPRVS